MEIIFSWVNGRLMFVDENGYECWPFGLQEPYHENRDAQRLLDDAGIRVIQGETTR